MPDQPSMSQDADPTEAKRITNLEAKIAALQGQIDDTRLKRDEATAKLKVPDASQTVQNHIRLLREYNDIRDIGTSLMGIIAENRHVQMKCVYSEFNVDEQD
ncbi:MAG: hypothetical protein Q9219_001727 [cf. Caloplaca sp. 3 TL-2023]